MPKGINNSAKKTNDIFMKKKDVAWLFTCVVLAVLLVISIILGVTGFYSSVTYLKSYSDLVAGNTFAISVLPNQANVASYTFDGAILPNELIPQVVQISGQNLDTDVYVRVKAKVFGEDGAEFDFATTEHFDRDEDGYFYYDDVLRGGNKITFCNYLIVPENNDFASGEKYILTFVVETLDVKYDIGIWKNS